MNFWGKISGAVADNRPLSSILLMISVLFGVFGYFTMPRQYNPEITLPAFEIQIPYPGASPKEGRDLVLRELEEKINEIPGVDTISSVARDGLVMSTVQFEVGENLEESKIKLLSKISENLDQRAGRIGEPQIKNITPDAVPILVFALTSETLSQNEIRKKAVTLSNTFRDTPGISNITLTGGSSPALRIRLDPEKLRIFSLSPAEVQNAIAQNIPRNRIGFLENSENITALEIDAGIVDAKSAGKILIAPGIFLEDIAEVSDGFSEKNSAERFWKKGFSEDDAVFLSIAKRKGENASSVAHVVLEKWEEEKGNYPELKSTIVRDDAQKAEREIAGLGMNLIQSVGIVGIVLFLFLGMRAAFVVALAIPLTLLLVFFSGFFFGQTVNRITLFALILSLGLLVDSATVVVETLVRQFHKKKSANIEGIQIGMSEIGTGLLLSTITSIIVFFPMNFITGMMGPYMGPIAFFVPSALFFSLLVALFLIPFLAKSFFSPVEKKPILARFFDRLSQKYAHLLEKILRQRKIQNRILTIAFLGLLAVFSFPILGIVHFQMLPKSNQMQFLVTIDAPANSDSERTEKRTHQVSEIILENPAVVSVQEYIGTPPVIDFNGLFRGFSARGERSMATIKVNLEKSESSTENIVAEIRKDIRATFPELGEVRVRLVEDPPGPPVRATLVAKIKGEHEKKRALLAREVERIFQKTEGTVDIDASDRMTGEKIQITIDPEKAQENGITNEQIREALLFAGGATRITEFWEKDAEEHAFVEMEFEKKNRDSLDDFTRIFVKNGEGKMLPLDSFLVKIPTRENANILFDEGSETTFVTAEMSQRSVLYAVIDGIKTILRNPPEGFEVQSWNLFGISFIEKTSGEKIQLEWGGEWKMTLENFRDLGIAMGVAFLLLYVVLVLQFKSFALPILILTTIFLAFLGILPGFALLEKINGTLLTATGLIGFIALMGIVVNNAILFLEFVNILRNRGIEKTSALVAAGSERLRPIVLTSLTTVLGSLTIAGDPVWSGLAWTIVFGLSLSTFLTLGIFPILYARWIR